MIQNVQHEKQTTAQEGTSPVPHEEGPVPYREIDIGEEANASTDGGDEPPPDGGTGV